MAKKKKQSHSSQQGSTTETEDRPERLEMQGVVDEALPGMFFRVKCANGMMVLATLAGKLRLNKIRILPGDAIVVEVSVYDTSRGRIVWRR